MNSLISCKDSRCGGKWEFLSTGFSPWCLFWHVTSNVIYTKNSLFSNILAYLCLNSRNKKTEIEEWHFFAIFNVSHWDFLILIARLILARFLYNKKVEIYKTEFKQGKNNKIQ